MDEQEGYSAMSEQELAAVKIQKVLRGRITRTRVAQRQSDKVLPALCLPEPTRAPARDVVVDAELPSKHCALRWSGGSDRTATRCTQEAAFAAAGDPALIEKEARALLEKLRAAQKEPAEAVSPDADPVTRQTTSEVPQEQADAPSPVGDGEVPGIMELQQQLNGLQQQLDKATTGE